MPRKYARRTFKRRRYARKRPSFISRAKSALSLAKSAYRGVRYIRGLVNSEMFKFDNTQTGVACNNTGGSLHLTGIAQGDGDSARTGNSVLVRSVNIKGILRYNTSSAKQFFPVRLMVVQDTQQVGDSNPAPANVLQQVVTYGHLNTQTVGRFKILFNRVYNLNTSTALGMPFQINLPMQHHVRFNGTAGTDIQRGGLYFMYLSNEGTVADMPAMDYEARVSYHDN